MSDTRICPKCKGLQFAQTVIDDLVIRQYRCMNCGRIDEPGLVPLTRRITYENSERRARARERERERKGKYGY